MLKRNGSVVLSEVENSFFLYPQNCTHIFVVGKGGGKPYNSGLDVGRLSLPDVSGNDGLENGSSAVGEKMNLIDDDKFDFLDKQPLPSFSGDNIPFFRSRDDDLSLFDLTLAQMHISS